MRSEDYLCLCNVLHSIKSLGFASHLGEGMYATNFHYVIIIPVIIVVVVIIIILLLLLGSLIKVPYLSIQIPTCLFYSCFLASLCQR